MRTSSRQLQTLIYFSALSLLLAPVVMAQSDTQPPQLLDMSFTPSSVDVTSSAQTLTFTVATNKKGKWQVSYADVNGDGRNDVIAHFETSRILLRASDTQGIVEGRTRDNRLFRGRDSVRVIK